MTAAAPANPPVPDSPPAPMAPLANPLRENRLNSSQDYRPEWDVPSLNGTVSDLLVREIRRVRDEKRKEPDPAQLLYVLLAQPGYGKTHLFGRLAHLLGDDILFVFVPAIEDPDRPLEHIRWHLVESLFRPRPPKHPAIVVTLARLCHPSFREYVSRFPLALKERHHDLAQDFESPGGGGFKMLEMVRAVNDLDPFLTLARSMVAKSPHLPGSVVRALALGWSPAADLARRWLRGEALPEEDLARLGLPDEVPRPLDVLRAVPTLLRHRVPVALCLDQVESVLDKPEGPRALTTRLMEALQSVPNLFVVLSCLESEWPEFYNRSFVAAKQRFRSPPLVLQPLEGGQAVELITNRLKDWAGAKPGTNLGAKPQSGRVWPFDEASLVRYADERFPSPRAVIQRCAAKVDEWLESGAEDRPGDRPGGPGLIDVTADGKPPAPPAEVFLRLWNEEMEAIRQTPARSLANSQEERLHRAVGEALRLARDGGWDLTGWKVADVSDGAIRQVGAEKIYSLAVHLAPQRPSRQAGATPSEAPPPTVSVAVPVTKVDNGYRFRFYLSAIEEALAEGFAGCLLVHQKRQFRMGSTTAATFEEVVRRGDLRLFALEEHPQTFQRLECLLGLLDKSAGGELQIDGRTVSVAECKDLVKRVKVLEKLDLFEALGRWGSERGKVKREDVKESAH